MSAKTVALPDGTLVPALGQGTWNMGDSASTRAAEIAALREGIERGLTLIDTAEMYGDGRSEDLVGEAIAELRDQVFLVSKALPQNASRARLRAACEASLERLGVEQLDLYLLHWRGPVPLAETVEAMERLVADGLIARWGVSNLDADDMAELVAAGGAACVTDQILYNLTRRSPELDLLPWLAGHRIPVMAYSPVEQGRLLRNATLRSIAAEFDATPAQVALAWVLRDPSVIAIPKAGSVAHVRDNHAALDLVLDGVLLDRLDAAFPRPKTRRPLEML
ncbi:aldo/keto reductase [Sphingomonas sp. PAMC 26621]|uniref:aldo/keto reductase n=1 Tax=Sphingomonas sp. PAMC 26621 TaxID=1112213 RepID=UPI00028810D4|nr:aldo/keto reductase [Sphingomonas sp. PAMC 26621]